MKHLFAVIFAAALVAAVPIAVKFGFDAKHLQRELVARTDTLTAVQTELKAVHDTLGVRAEQLMAMTAQFDSVSQSYAQSVKRIDQLSSKLAGLAGRADSLQAVSGQLIARLNEQSDSLAGVRSLLANTAQILAGTRDRLDSTATLLTERTLFIAQIHPWFAKWKHDATERNWLEKIFGGDKAKAPELPEPVFPVLPIPSNDSAATDTLARPQVSI